MNLATKYLGLSLQTPFVIGASPCCDNVEMMQLLQDAGASAVVMRSLFAEQFDSSLRARALSWSTDGYPDFADYQLSPEEYLRQIDRLKRSLSVPVIASLNGYQPGRWLEFSAQLERAGADAIELNFYQVVTNPTIDADQVEAEMLEMVGAVSGVVNIPVAAKISPFHASVAQLAVALELAGAAGVVVFNRFYQPDINAEDMSVQPLLKLSQGNELLLRLRWLAIMSPLLRGSLAVTGGVHNALGVVKSILAGAHAVQVVSAVLRHGPHVITSMCEGVENWMREHRYGTLDEFRGLLNLQRCGDPATLERANYIRVLQSWKI